MLGKFFLHILNMSLTAGVMILAVMLIRLLLRRAPKIFSYCLWAVVLFRLICPVSFYSPISLLGTLGAESSQQGSMTYISEDLFRESGAQITAYPAERDLSSWRQSWDVINGWMQQEGIKQNSEKAAGDTHARYRGMNLQDILWPAEFSVAMKAGMLIWLAGVIGFAAYSLVNFRKLKGVLRSAKAEIRKGNIRVFRTDKVKMPFVIGILRPNIYLPEEMEWHEQSYILIHERIHIRRGDHIWRILAYAALCLHWFNPLVWAAFFLSERDMEMSCDESVIRKFGSQIKKDYSNSLLTMSIGKRAGQGLSPAFAEGDTGSRIRNVLSYKKPTLLLVGVTVIVCGLAAAFLMGNPINASQDDQVQDIEILYHADDGEFDRSIHWGTGPSGDDFFEEDSPADDEEKIVITLATATMDTGNENEIGMLELLAAKFNKDNERYRVELRTCHFGAELLTMRNRLLAEVGTGGGPDIMTESVFPLTQEIMDSGVLVNLTPYLEQSGITPETFFPAYAAAFSGDRVYGVQDSLYVTGLSVDAEVLGDREPPKDIEALADLLLEYPGHGSFEGEMFGGIYILRDLLQGSENLWGMVDWEEKTCDFTGPLFSKLLEVSKRYREDGKKGYEPVVHSYYVSMQNPPSYSVSTYYPGSVPVGFFFDDGSHYQYNVSGSTLMINANTEHLEGAYAFVAYVLSKGGQNKQAEPIQKELWETAWQYYSQMSEYGVIPAPLNEETKQETLDAYEDARYVPRRAEAILAIVYEEAEGYIEGDRSKEDVIDVIQNRVQLFLDEQG